MTTTQQPPAGAGLDPLARLRDAALEMRELEERVSFLVRAARNPKHLYSDGRVHSWAEIGQALGTTRQAAQQRFGPGLTAPTTVTRCYFDGRAFCDGAAVVRRGDLPLCEPCDSAGSSSSRLPRRPL